MALGVGLIASGAVLGSAASLGSLNNASFGSGVQVVASCDTDGVGLTYTNVFDPTVGRYKVSSATVSGIAAACAGKNLYLTLEDSGNVARGTGSIVSIAGTSEVVTITGNSDSSVVSGAAVVISE